MHAIDELLRRLAGTQLVAQLAAVEGASLVAPPDDACRATPLVRRVEDGRSGLLVGQHDINGACDRIVRVYDDRTIAGRIGNAAAKFVSENYHVSAFCVRLKDAWSRAASGRTVRILGDYEEPLIERREEEAIKAA